MAAEKPKSLLLVKPAAADKFAEIKADLDTENGWYLKVVKSKRVHLPDAVAWEFLKGYDPAAVTDPSYDAAVAAITGGPCVIAVLEQLDGGAVEDLKKACATLEKKYGDVFYCSGSTWAALREVNFFFPYVARLPVTTTVVACGSSAIAEQVKLRCLDEGLLVLVEKSLTAEELSTLGLPDSDFVEPVGMLVEGRGAVEKVQLILGPSGPGTAKKSAPGTIRAICEGGGDLVSCYSSSVDAKYEKEQALLGASVKFEQSLLMVKPDAMESVSKIIAAVEGADFTILDKKTVQLTDARAEAFYEAQASASHFKSLVRHMTSAPVCILVVGRTSAISTLLQLAGPENPRTAKASQPTSLRALFGNHVQRNAVHVSASAKDARAEIAFFFPHIVRSPLPDREETQDFLMRKSVSAKAKLTEVRAGIGFDIEPSLLQFVSSGLVSLCQTRPHGEMKNLDALQYLADWLEQNNPNKPQMEEPAIEVPAGLAQTTAEGVAFTMEEPADAAAPEVIEIDVKQEKGEKLLQEFDTPPMVVLATPDTKEALMADLAASVDFVFLSVKDLVEAESASGGKGSVGKEVARKYGGAKSAEPWKEIDIKLVLPLLRFKMLEYSEVGRFVVCGLKSFKEMILFEQEVTASTFVLDCAEEVTEEGAAIDQYYTPTGKFRSVASATDPLGTAGSLMLPKVLYLLGAEGSGKEAVAESLEMEYGYCNINVPALLQKLAKEPTTTGKAIAASLAAGEIVDKAILGPEIVEQMRGARRFGFTTFVLCGFPQSVEQLRFFESQMACKSEALVLDFPRADVMELARKGVDGSAQETVEKAVGAFFGPETAAMLAGLEAGPCSKVYKVPLTVSSDAGSIWASVTPFVRPHVTVILGPPGSPDVTEFAGKYCAKQGSTLLDVDALLDAELERRTAVGIQMANMLARGQVIPVRMILEVMKSACRWTNSPALVLEKFPRFLDEAELLAKHFTVDRVILAEVGEAKHAALQESQGLSGDAYAEKWHRTLQVATYFAASGLLVKVDMDDVKSKESPADMAMLQAAKVGRPKCIALVGMPYVGTSALAGVMASKYSFDVIGAIPEGTSMKDYLEEYLNNSTASMVVLDNLLTDNDAYVAYEEAFGAPAVLYLTASETELPLRAADELKDQDDSEVQPKIDAAKEALEAPTHYLNKGLANVSTIATPDIGETAKDVYWAGIVDVAMTKLQPQIHIVLGPPVRDVTAIVAGVLAQKASGKQVVLDAKELATPSPRYPAELNAVLAQAKASGEPILPGVWSQVFEQRLPEYPLQHLFLVNFPIGGVYSFPSLRDELEVLSQYAVVKGLIVAEFSAAGLQKYCYKGQAKTPDSAEEAYKYFRGMAVTDSDAYLTAMAARREYLDSLRMDKPTWLTTMPITQTTGSLAEAAREAAKATLTELDLL